MTLGVAGHQKRVLAENGAGIVQATVAAAAATAATERDAETGKIAAVAGSC